ncbi:hypothetical protein Hanom_Chr07g00587961 [Helianthus anomalus]
MIQIEPTHRHRPAQRHELPACQYLRRQPPPEPLTLESFSLYVEQRFDRLEHLIESLRGDQPRQQEGPAGADARVDPEPPVQVVGESNGAAGQQQE